MDALVLRQLYELVVQFWHGRLVATDIQLWRVPTLFPIYKGRGDQQDLGNWRGVVLLDIISKLVCRILNNRLALAGCLCSDMEIGYRKQRGVSDCVFVLGFSKCGRALRVRSCASWTFERRWIPFLVCMVASGVQVAGPSTCYN